MHGPEVGKGRTAALQGAANDTFQILKEVANDACRVGIVEARRRGMVVWSFLYGLATLSSNHQVPRSVDASAERLVDLALRHLFRSFRSPGA